MDFITNMPRLALLSVGSIFYLFYKTTFLAKISLKCEIIVIFALGQIRIYNKN
ncbi:MAG: hypothetical protein RLZ76_1429 [Bacteroidota bacterium]|jgi:hypothetical protein